MVTRALALVFALPTASVLGAEGPGGARAIVGAVASHEVREGDSLATVGSRLGVDVSTLALDNGLAPQSTLTPGQILAVDSRHLVPAGLDDGVLINVPQRMLFLMREGRAQQAYPAALGRRDWPTPPGAFRVITKEVEPAWDVPISIQEEMRQQGKPVITRMPHCEENPLGEFWLGLSLPCIGIHGTIAPNSIYRFATHGCIRLHPDDIAALFSLVEVGTMGRIVYETVLLFADPDGTVYLEAHPDAYRRNDPRKDRLLVMARSLGLDHRIDWRKARRVAQAREGIARDVTRRP